VAISSDAHIWPYSNSSSRLARFARQHALACALVVLGWASLVAAGLPPPHIDDVWYVDPAISFAQTGRLEAPALARVLAAFGTQRCFLSFPFYPLLLGTWFRILGVSFGSAAAFWIACGAVSSVSLRAILRALGAGAASEIAALVYLPLQVQCYGLRPEQTGYALSLAGAALLMRPTPARRSLGCLLTCGAVFCASNFVAVAPGLALTAVCSERVTPALLRRLALTGAFTAALTLALFTLAIGAHFSEFVRQVSAMSRVTFSRSQTLSFVFEQLAGHGFAKLHMGPLYALYFPIFAVAMTPAGRFFPAPARTFIVGVGLTLVMTIAYRARSFDVMNPLVFASVLLAAPALAIQFGRLPVVAVLGCVGACSVAGDCVNLLLTPACDKVALARVRRRASELSLRVVVDEFSARFVYDYRYPRDALSFHHQQALENPMGFEARAEFKRPDEVWIVSRASLCKLTPTLAVDDCKRLNLLGRELTNAYANVREMAVLESRAPQSPSLASPPMRTADARARW